MSSSTAVCSNTACRQYKSERWRNGWRLRNGGHAHLCDGCASAFQEGKFCNIFHATVPGWRSCESCLKPVHCGCIMSAHTFALLDDGGIHCIFCEKNTTILTQNPACPPPLFSPISFPHMVKDPSVRNWNHNAGTGSVGPLWQSAHVSTFSAQTEVQTARICLGFNHEETQSLCMGNGMPVNAPNQSTVTQYSLASAPCSDTENLTRISMTQLSIPLTGNPLSSTSNNMLDASSITHVNHKLQADISSSRSQLFPLYSPITPDQELHQVSGDSNSTMTPLFEKMLSASDAGRVGRLVLPKKCAETYFPPISDPEGLPLKFQDAKGQEWTFQFRFWLNNNSRMYVLEGITPCIQSMELQAGDIVTFSRLEPHGKFLMGYRKNAAIPTCNWAEKVDPLNLQKIDKSGFVAKEALVGKSSFSKRNNGIVGSKRKCMKLDTISLIELKVNLEEAQGLLRPRSDNMPKVFLIEDFEFEEYEDAPAIGRPTFITKASVGHCSEDVQWAQCDRCCKWRRIPPHVLPPSGWTCSDNAWDPKRSSCIASQELSTRQLENLMNMNSVASKRSKATELDSAPADCSDGLHILNKSGIVGEGKTVSTSSAEITSSKHPRHRPGCSCIVCIQPSSGKGPKHLPTCTCNVCAMLRRRFQTMMSRREKKKSRKGPETVQPDETLDSSDKADPAVKPSASPTKGHFDLNIQPEREEEPSPHSINPVNMMINNFDDVVEEKGKKVNEVLNVAPIGGEEMESGNSKH